jgi:predicted O-methyltransferase YrrM
MLSGQVQGRFLAMLSKLVQPKRVLEIGTFTGYSAICLCEGLNHPDGLLYTIDINEELAPIQEQYFEKAGCKHQIKVLTGNALDLIPAINETFDLIFIDADKINYLNYYKLVIDKLRPGGLIIADNVLWSGKVLSPKPNDEDTLAICQFNDAVQADPQVENLMLPLRDGMTLIRKKT